MTTENEARQARALQAAAEAGNARVRELKARPWWRCRSCGATFRWDRHHVCGEPAQLLEDAERVGASLLEDAERLGINLRDGA